MKTRIIQTLLLAIMGALLAGCGTIPYKASTNSKETGVGTQSQQTSFDLRDKRYKMVKDGQTDCSPKKHKDVLVMLALSGGGSRAALLSGLSMIQMQDVYGSDVLSEVDLISSVSGGSLAAGYYEVSGDQNPEKECAHAVSGRTWNKDDVTNLMSKNYILPWFGNWFWPDNIILYWTTTYDRTDMMAQTFADNLYDTNWVGKDLVMSELNPSRPNLIINATQGSLNSSGTGRSSNGFGQPFTFTREDFTRICSRIDDYEVSRAVMASATFPGVFNFNTLKNHCTENTYVHLFDGGNSDNLGLTSIKREIWNLSNSADGTDSKRLSDYRNIIVILIDAYTDTSGVSESAKDPRKWYDYIVDTNFITATDSLLAKNRDNLVTDFKTKNIFPYAERNLRMVAQQDMSAEEQAGIIKKERKSLALECQKFFSWKSPEEVGDICANTNWAQLNRQISKKLTFVHVSFADIVDVFLRRQLNNIATNFKLNGNPDTGGTGLDAKEAIQCAVPLLFGQDNTCSGKDYRSSEEARVKWKEVHDVLAQ